MLFPQLDKGHAAVKTFLYHLMQGTLSQPIAVSDSV